MINWMEGAINAANSLTTIQHFIFYPEVIVSFMVLVPLLIQVAKGLKGSFSEKLRQLKLVLLWQSTLVTIASF